MLLGHFRELLGHQLECFPVVLGFPRRLRRRRQGMNKCVHIAKGDVVFFVPEGRRQNDIGIIGGGIHTEVEIYQEVQLADRFLIMPFYFFDQILGRLLVPHDVVACSEEVLERQFMAPHAGSDEIPAIHGEHFKVVFGGVDIVNGKIQLAIPELFRHPVFHLVVGFAPRLDGFLVKLHRVLFVDLREERQPSQANGKGVHVGRVVELGKFLGPRGPLGVQRHIVVFPLAGLEIPQGGAVHQPRRPRPIEGAAEIDKGGIQAGVLGADVVVEITPVHPVAAAQRKHHRLVAVIDRSAVVKVLNSRAGYEQ